MSQRRCPHCGTTLHSGECLRCLLELGVRSQPSTPYHEIPSSISHYRVLSLLGEGGMGVVYEAEQEHPYRRVAIKALKPTSGDIHTARFIAEYEVLAFLDHPAIAKIYEAGVATVAYPSGLEMQSLFFAMEFVDGELLVDHCDGRGLNYVQRVALFTKLVAAIEYAHQRGVIHRDIKPSNIIVDSSGEPKIVDFGVARGPDLAHAPTLRTQAGEIFGTVGYMSPEQLRGDPGAIDTRTDVFALGVTLYELLTGRMPFATGNSVEAVAARLAKTSFEPASRFHSKCTGDMDAILEKCLSPDKEDRYGSALGLHNDLVRHINGEVVEARDASTWYLIRRGLRRHRRQAIQAAAAFLAVVTFAVVGWNLFLSSERANRKAQERLFESHVSGARLAIGSSQMDRRRIALSAVESAAAIHSDSTLVDLAIAAMALDGLIPALDIPDVDVVFRQTRSIKGFVLPVLRGSTFRLVDGYSGETMARFDIPPQDPFKVVSYSLSPDLRYIVAKHVDQRDLSEHVTVWDVATGEPLLKMPLLGDCAQMVGDRLIAAKTGVHVYSVPSGDLEYSFAPDRVIRTHIIHPTEPLVALVLNDEIEVWNFETRSLVYDMSIGRADDLSHNNVRNFISAGWDHDGNRIAVSTATGHIHVWDMRQKALLQTLSKHDRLGFAVLFGPGNLLFSTGWDGATRIWDLNDGTPAFAPLGEGQRLLAADRDRVAIIHHHTVRVYQYDGSNERDVRFTGNDFRDLRFSRSGKWFATAGNSVVDLTDVETNRRTVLLEGSARAVRFDPDESRLYAAARSGLYCWSVDSNSKPLWHVQGTFQAICTTLDGDSIYAVAGNELEGVRGHYEARARKLAVFDAHTGKLVADLGPRPGATDPVFSPHGRFFAIGARRGAYGLWDRNTQILLRSSTTRHTRVGFSSNGRYYLEADENGIAIFDTATWKECGRTRPRRTLPSFAVDPSNERLAHLAPGVKGVRICDIRDGRYLATLPLHRTDAGPLCFSPDGTKLVVGMANGDLVTWHLDRIHHRLQQLQIGSPFVFPQE